MTEKIADATVYMMFLKGERDQPDNKYIGVTTLSLSERLKKHKQNTKSRDERNSRLYKVMYEKGIENWEMVPLAEAWLSTIEDRRDLEKYYIRLLKPDLNTRNGSLSDEGCERQRNYDSQLWTCSSCLTVTRVGNKWRHYQTKYHKAIDNLMFDLD